MTYRCLLLTLSALVVAGSLAMGWSSAAATADTPKSKLVPGAILEVYDLGKKVSRLPQMMPEQKPNVSKTVQEVNFTGEDTVLKDNFYARVHGWLLIRRAGKYQFRLTSDDGSRLSIAGQVVVDHDGNHGATPKDGTVVLKAGRHPFLVEWYEGGGAESLKFEWLPPGSGRRELVPAGVMACEKEYDHATSSGHKKILVNTKIIEHLSKQEAIDEAIEDGMAFLLREIEKNQVSGAGAGQVALETYALVVAGVSLDHPLIEANYAYLKKNLRGQRNTYALCCAVFAQDAAISQLEYDHWILSPPKNRDRIMDNPAIGKKYRDQLKRTVLQLLKSQQSNGAFRYLPSDKTVDNSCTQFAALAMGIGAKRRVGVPIEAWAQMGQYFIDNQMKDGRPTELRLTPYPKGESGRGEVTVVEEEKDKEEKGAGDDTGAGRTGVKKKPKDYDPMIGVEGLKVACRGWGYQKPGSSTWNMTCSGLSSMLLIRKYTDRIWTGPQREKLNESIRDGYGWMMENWSGTHSYYGMYSLEKVADIGGVKKFGSHDWYEEVSEHLVSKQEKPGNWPDGGSHGENPRVSTSFALLILNRATMLLTMNPASRVIFTGPGSEQQSELGREWVYIEELDTCLHCTQIMRTIRLRPSKKLVKFLEKIVGSYDPGFKHEIVKGLIGVRNGVKSKSLAKLIDRWLADIVGRPLDSDDQYLAWVTTVEAVMEIGEKQQVDKLEELLQHYRDAGEGLTLKRRVIHAVIRMGARDAIPLLLEDLNHRDEEFRLNVYRAIAGITVGRIPTFDYKGDAKTRAAHIEQLRAWWEKERAKGE